jgi:N-ethylmaleimide reductase
MWTDQAGLQDLPVPHALTPSELIATKNEYVQAARNAIEAGFDGIELHAANGYLLEQFLSPHANQRTDNYGGSIENRARFVLEVAKEVSIAIGSDRTGIRLSPYGVFNDMPHYPEIEATYTFLAKQLNALDLVYLHLLDHSPDGAPEVPVALKRSIRSIFKNTIIMTGGYNLTKGEADISNGLTDLVAFGKPFITNPDLPYRLRKNLPLSSKLDANTLYTPGEKGYTDYPVFAEEKVNAY